MRNTSALVLALAALCVRGRPTLSVEETTRITETGDAVYPDELAALFRNNAAMLDAVKVKDPELHEIVTAETLDVEKFQAKMRKANAALTTKEDGSASDPEVYRDQLRENKDALSQMKKEVRPHPRPRPRPSLAPHPSPSS